MKKPSLESPGRRRLEEASHPVRGIEPLATLTYEVPAKTKGVGWVRSGILSHVIRAIEERLEVCVGATLDPMGTLPRDVALTFRFKDDQTWEIRLQAVGGAKLRRAVMLTLAEKFREIVDSRTQEKLDLPD